MVHRIEEVVAATPEVAGFARRTGAELGLFATEQNRGDIVVKLKPASARKRNAEEIIEEQRAAFATEMPGMTIEFVQLLQDMLGDLEGNPEPVEVKIFGDDLAQLGALAARTAERLSKVPGLVDLVVPQRGNPEVDVRIDPTRAARVGFTVEQVASQLSAGLLGQVATSFRRGDRLIDVRVRFPDSKRFDLDWIREFPLTSAAGEVVPLSTTSTIRLAQGETQLFREDLRQMVPVTARLEGRDLGSGVRDVRAALAADPWPVGYSYRIGGLFESQQASFRSMLLVLAIAVLLVFGVLVAQFRRFTPALVILSAAPLSLVGAFGLLLLTGTPLNVSSFMGLILLIGLIVKNGIILVDYADLAAARGASPTEALLEAGSVRLRPILMTTLCTLFGLLAARAGLGLRRRAAEAARDRRDRRAQRVDRGDAAVRADDPGAAAPPRRARSALSGTAIPCHSCSEHEPASGRLGGQRRRFCRRLFFDHDLRNPPVLSDLLDGQDQIREACPSRLEVVHLRPGLGMALPLRTEPVDLRPGGQQLRRVGPKPHLAPGMSTDVARRGRLSLRGTV